MIKYKFFLIVFVLSQFNFSFASNNYNSNQALLEVEDNIETGTIRGRVVDKFSQTALIGVNIFLKGTDIGTASDREGSFIIETVPVGYYTVQFSYIGYEPVIITDVIVRSDRITFLNTELKTSPLLSDSVMVFGGYFPEIDLRPVSTTNFSNEEIRRAATIGGDINRIIDGLPSLSNENQNNYIVARGGSNIENQFYIDNMRVPNINHFPIPGTTGGGISLLNVDLINQISVNTGGFSAKYGNVLSSVIDVSYREGNRDEFDMQLDLNFTGLSGIAEGPLGNNEGSWMFSAKHSFTDILFKIIDIDQEPVVYDELQGKIVFDISPEHRLSVIDIFGTDRWKILRDEAIDRSDNWYGNFNMMENLLGLNWRYIWGENGFSNTSVSHSWLSNKIDVLKTNTQEEAFLNYSSEHEIAIRNVNHLQFNAAHRIDFGVEASTTIADYDNLFAETINQMGQISPMLKLNNEISTWETGAFVEFSWNPVERFKITPGLRWDYFSYNKKNHVSPRFSISFKIDEYTTITGATGIFYQHAPMYFLSQSDNFKNLSDIKSYHVVLGAQRLITEDMKLSLEIYNKNYQQCPMDPDQSSLFILDENIYNQFYGHHKNIVSQGTANVKGVEVMLQKKMLNKLYGLISFTYYQSTYTDLNGEKHNRITDNRILGAIEAGYKPDNQWELSLRYSYAGGIPYTPFDDTASIEAGVGIYDATKIMSERLPPYSCLSVRAERRFYFARSNLIVYLSIWNLLNRKNISYHYWDEYGENAGNYTQFPMLPVFGVEFEF